MSRIDEKELLARELRARSAGVGGHPIGFDEVRRSARRIKRRRAVVTGAVAAVFASIALPTGLGLTSGLTTGEGPVEQPTVAASPTQAVPRPDGPVTLTLRGLEDGPAPAIPYFTADGLVTPEGTLETDVVLQAVERRGDGWVGLGYAGEGAQVLTFDEDLEVTGSEPSGMTMAANADGSLVAYVRIEPDGVQTLLSTSGLDAMSWSFPARGDVEPVGYVGPGEVVYQVVRGESVEAGIAYGDGTTRPISGFVKVTAASEANGLIAGQTRANADGSGCFGVLDPARSTSEPVPQTCDYSLESFSPDGRYVLATDAYQSGSGWRTLTVLDARTFEPVVEYRQPRDGQVALVMTAWESPDSLLAVATEGSTTTIVRMGLDGRLEQVVDPVEGDPFADLPFSFSQTDL
jgi:hypothetical protein